MMVAFLETTYGPRHLAACSPTTWRAYRRVCRYFRKFLGRKPGLIDLSDANLLAYARWRRDAGVSAATVGTEFTHLRCLWQWAAQHGYVQGYPEAKCPFKAAHREPTAWTAEQFSQVLAGCDALASKRTKPICGVPANLWWRAFVLVGRDSGFRKAALLHLLWEDVDLDAGIVLARAEYSKTNVDSRAFLSPDGIAAVRAILLPTRSLVFPYDRNVESGFHFQWRRILKAAGLPVARRNQTHRLRRTSATLVAQLGGLEAARAHLGHRSAAMTLSHYIDQSQLPATNYAARFPRP